jgi:hypothetical protein
LGNGSGPSGCLPTHLFASSVPYYCGWQFRRMETQKWRTCCADLFGFCLGFLGVPADRKRREKESRARTNTRRISKDGYAKIWTDRTSVQIRAGGRLPVGVAGTADVRRPLVRAPHASAGIHHGDHGRPGGHAVRRDSRPARRQRTLDLQAPGQPMQGEHPGCGRETQTSSTA